MMPHSTLPESADNQEQLVREVLEVQKSDLANKRAELEIRRHEIEANKEIALASIAAQKDDIVKRGDVFASVQKGRLWLFGGIAFLVAIVIIFAMYTGQTDIAIKLIEIGGAVLLGYFAGFHRGKAQALEAQNNRQNTSE